MKKILSLFFIILVVILVFSSFTHALEGVIDDNELEEDEVLETVDDEIETDETIDIVDYLKQLEGLSEEDRITLERMLPQYANGLSFQLTKSVVDIFYNEGEVEIGQLVTTLKNFSISMDNEIVGEDIQVLIDSAKQIGGSRHLMFQMSLELRKMARINSNQEGLEEYIQEMTNNLDEEDLDVSEFKKWSNKYRKSLREQERKKKIKNGNENNNKIVKSGKDKSNNDKSDKNKGKGKSSKKKSKGKSGSSKGKNK